MKLSVSFRIRGMESETSKEPLEAIVHADLDDFDEIQEAVSRDSRFKGTGRRFALSDSIIEKARPYSSEGVI